MKRKSEIVWLLPGALICFSAAMAGAVPASPNVSRIVQPDGNIVDVVTKGDEWNNSTETLKGYAITKAKDGFWYYVMEHDNGIPVSDSVKAHYPPPVGTKKHVRPKHRAGPGPSRVKDPLNSTTAMPYGEFNGKILFILAQFTDRQGTYTEESFAFLLRRSIKNYYRKASYGLVTLSPAEETFGTVDNGVVGWLDLGYAHPNTGGNTGSTNRQIARDAIRKADSYVDFKAFDLNGDGYADSSELAVVVIVAGFERSYGAGYEPCVWGHKWDMGGSFQPPIVDEVIVGADHDGAGGYAQFGEIHQSNPDDRHHATVGIMVHELGHLIFGLPDLYDTDDSSSGVGAFCVMGGGSWGQKTTDMYEGQTPVLPCAWIKYNRGWVSAPSVIEGAEILPAAGASRTTGANSAIKRPTCTSNEFFLIENREPLGYDRGLEKYLGTGFGGIAIWHVDESVPNNSDDSHRMVDLEEADGSEMGESRGEKTDLWYAGNETTFNRLSYPSSITYSGIPSEATIIIKTRAKLVMKVTFRISHPRRALAMKESMVDWFGPATIQPFPPVRLDLPATNIPAPAMASFWSIGQP